MDDARTGPRLAALRRVLAVAAVVIAALGGATGALAIFGQDKTLSTGTVRVSVEPFHDGALDVYVPVVDWGARFGAVDLPARLHVDVRAIDRDAVQRLASGASLDVEQVRSQARDAIASYIKALLAVMLLAALGTGLVAALAVRGGPTPRLRWTATAAALTAVAVTAVTALTLPPRGRIDTPQYYAFGPDIPRALEALEAARRSGRSLDQELNAQLVGLARLVVDPADRVPVAGAPKLTLASDLHNNALVLDILRRSARGGPLFFAGDLTDRGTRLETTLVRQVVAAGDPFVFVTGNHDSDSLARELAGDGAIVLTQSGRLRADGTTDGKVIHTIAGLRVAGYGDPFERRAADDFKDRYEDDPGDERRGAFASWLATAVDAGVDVVMVHEPQLITAALAALQADPPPLPLVLLVGHTHKAKLERHGAVTVLNGGSVGAGGTGNLAGGATPIGLAILAYDAEPDFAPLAADLVEIDPANGSATARRARLDEPPARGRGA